MRKFSIGIFFTVLMMSLLVGCIEQEEQPTNAEAETTLEAQMEKYPAQEIDAETDVCDICAMAVADDQHATQIVLKNDRILTFDDLGCLYQWIEENGEENIGAKYVRDFHTQDWVLIDEATYLFDEDIETPMSYGVISFKEENDAKQFIEKEEMGALLTVDELTEHKWEMMHHDHDHHDEYEEDEHNDHEENHKQ